MPANAASPIPSADDATAARAGSRSLVPMLRPEVVSPPSLRPSAPFLAQLIATAQQVPQTRARRRAEPADAAACYAAAIEVIRSR
jgi:hypothetical protein